MKTLNRRYPHQLAKSRTLFAVLAAMTIGCPSAMAELKVTFNKGGDNTTPTGTITVDLGTNSASMSNLTGTGGLKEPSISGALAGLSGSFDINFQALGTVASPLLPSDFTGGAADGVFSGAAVWAGNSDINNNTNNAPGQGIVFTFDFTNLVGATAIDLTGVRWWNDANGSRLSFRDEGSGTSTALYPGGTTSGTGTNQTVTFLQSIDTADQVAFWSAASGQKRLAEFIFNFVPDGITPPVGLTATTNGVQVNLNWSDDLSGTLDFYTVKRSETPGGPYSVIAPSVATSDYIDTTATTGTTYYYVVTATDNIGPTETAPSAEKAIDVVLQPPVGLVLTQGDGVIDLDWDDNTSGILGSYSVYRSETAGSFIDPPIATGLTTSEYSDTSVTNGTTYYYVVTATDNLVSIESGNSAQRSGTPFTPVLTTELYAHLDATNVASVTEDAGVVSEWADLTANGFIATPGAGSVFYPSTSVSDAGLEGVEFGSSGRSNLLLFDAAVQDTWLNFTSGAAALPYTGFAVFAAVHTDTILGGINRDVVMGNTETKFSIRYENGRPRLFLGGSVLQNTAGAVEAGETVIFAVNYNASTGEVAFWDSQSGATATATIPAGDFSDGAGLFLGGSVNGDQYMNGMIGEVKIYRGTMDSTTFASERNALTFKWAGLTAPVGLVATPGDSTVELDWADQEADSYNVYRDDDLAAEGLATSSFTDTMLTNGQTYEYFVEAVKDGDISLPSDLVTATPFASVVGSELYLHLDATDEGSVTVVNGNEVQEWADLTANGNFPAVKDAGILLYPSDSLSPTNQPGLDTGDVTKNTLLVFNVSEQDAWLDFTAPTGALPYDGFAVFVVFKADAILGSDKRDIVFANNGNPSGTTGSFAMKYEGGVPQAVLGGQTASLGNALVDAGDTVVLAGNYDVATGTFELWDSENAASAVISVPVGDFSSTQAMYLGGSLNPGQSMEGMIGEVKIYRGAMTPAEFEAERNALSIKWLGAIPTSGFATWITGTFANGAVTNQGPDDDDDNDGISNLLEYAIAGEDPTVPNPAVGTLTSNSLSFTKRGDAVGLTYAIQESTDLGVTDDWTEVTGGSYVNDPATISYGFTPGTPAKNFLRLEVTN